MLRCIPNRCRIVMLVLCGLVSFHLLGCRCQSKDRETRRRPNLVIVLVDTLRADHLGYHDYRRKTSPRIDALKQQSTAFMNHYAHASRTGPSTASIFTGLHPQSHGVVNPLTKWDAKGTLSDEQTTLAEILSRKGYNCRGFVGNLNVRKRFGFAQGFDDYRFIRSTAAPDIRKKAQEVIEEDPAPFFLYLHYMEPHSSYRAPKPYRRLFVTDNYEGPVTGAHHQLDDILRGKLKVEKRDIEQLITLYDQEIRCIDDEIHKIVQLLKSAGAWDNTVFVFTADHGEEFWDHRGLLHGYTLYEEQLHVPLYIFAPWIKGGEQILSVTRHVDLLPTLLDLLGIETDRPFQGKSLMPFINGEKQGKDAGPVFAQASLKAVKTVQGESYMKDGWKLIRMRIPRLTESLYYIPDDPAEQNDLAAKKPEKLSELRDEMLRFQKSLPVGKGGEVTLSTEEIDQLRALGYMN